MKNRYHQGATIKTLNKAITKNLPEWNHIVLQGFPMKSVPYLRIIVFAMANSLYNLQACLPVFLKNPVLSDIKLWNEVALA